MKSYTFLYSEPIRRYQFLIITFALIAFMIILPSLSFFENIQPLFIIIFFLLPISVGISFYLYFIRAEIPCIVTPTPTSILIELSKTDLFIKNREILIPLTKIKSIKEDQMPDKNLTAFYSIHFIENKTSIRLTQLRNTSKEELSEFSSLLSTHIDKKNSTVDNSNHETNIAQGSYMDSWWAKSITVIVYISLVFYSFFWIFDSEDISWRTALKLYTFCIFWLISFHNRKRK